MTLLSMTNVSLAFGGPPLLDGVNLRIEPGERICLLGRNGTGKSTLMRLASGEIPCDSGEIIRRRPLRVARLGQDVPEALDGSVYDVVESGLAGLKPLLARYHALAGRMETSTDERLVAELAALQHELESADGWLAEQRVECVLSRLSLPGRLLYNELSGGLKRRALLAMALVSQPDLLFLDEPTNHLDITAINWLEEFLRDFRGAILFVTHDRQFLQKLATRIVWLDRGKISSWPGDYANFLRRQEEALHAENVQADRFDKKLAAEETWIRQGIKARRTRNEGRVRALEELRRQRLARREQQGTARLRPQDAAHSGKLVAVAENISFSYGGTQLICDLSTTILRGDRVGIIGPNGVGKTTLLRLLLGECAPDSGTLRLGSNLTVCFFDQHRNQLDMTRTVAENVADGKDTVLINNNPRHIVGYLRDFLFSPERARSPAGILSGGEKNRLLLARLFTRPCNVMVLDEPTNDLDMETLELLEEMLLEYQGTLLLVSHDRAFLNSVVTSTLVFENDGRVVEYAGGYDDWLRQRPVESGTGTTAPKKTAARGGEAPRRKLSYKDEKELAVLPQKIEALEKQRENLSLIMATPDFYRQGAAGIEQARQDLELLESSISQAYARWEELENIKAALKS